MVMRTHITTDNFLLIETGANDDIDEDFQYEERKLRHPSNNNEKNTNKDKNNTKIDNKLNKNSEFSKEKKSKDNEEKDLNYEQFFKYGGFVGENKIDRSSTLQSHAIKIKNKK